MPPKRGRPPKASSSKPAQAPKKTTSTRPKRSKATANTKAPQLSDYSPQNDEEILRAFDFFAAPNSDVDDGQEDDEDGADVIKLAVVRRCLSTLNLPKPPPDFFDDPEQTHLTRSEFFELAHTLRETMSSAPSSPDPDREDEEYAEAPEEEDDEQVQEVAHAFSMFTHNRTGNDVRITLADLKRVARELREEVDEGTLRMMIEEANGELGKESVEYGVGMNEFEEIMRRAGVFG